MSIFDRTKNAALSVTGRVKETAGVAFGDRDMEYRGQVDQTTANLRKAGGHVTGAVKSARKAVGL